ncbi:MAG: cell division protein FtsQ/DivIB [Planctomycetota bacterium]
MKRKKSFFRKKKKGGGLFNDLAGVFSALGLSRLFSRAFLFAFLMFAGLLIIEWMAYKARNQGHFTVYPSAVRCLSRPSWLASSNRITTEVVGKIQAHLSRFSTVQIFNTELEEHLRTDPSAFSPWIEAIESFESIYPSRYRVMLKLRRPVAIFSERNRSYFIDGNGVVITSVSHLDQGRISSFLPLISGFGDAKPVREGRATGNPHLIEGAAVAKEIEILHEMEEFDRLQVTEIDVTNYGSGRPDGVTLYTGDNVRILWGRSARNLKYQGIDPTPMEKAMKLKEFLDKNPTLENVDMIPVTFRGAQSTYTPKDDGV